MASQQVLLLGGTGKVAREIAPLLAKNGYEAIIFSRSGKLPKINEDLESHLIPFKGDILKKETYSNLFTQFSNIKSVFLVSTADPDSVAAMRSFIDFAREHGVKRFVLLSASVMPKGSIAMGQIHQYLEESGVEFAVLRPSWFQENFLEKPNTRFDIEAGTIVSATGNGKIPWVSAKDIAAVGYHGLTTPNPPNTDYVILGPELLSYDDCAAILSSVLNREITHKNISQEELTKVFERAGVPSPFNQALAAMDVSLSNGAEERLNNVVETVTGRKPIRFREFAEANKSAWS